MMALQLREIFLKPVDRPIDGVIKADDETSLRVELDEYVITGEIAQRLGEFLMPTTTTVPRTVSGFRVSSVQESRTS